MLVLIDNYDSFTYTIAQYFEQLGVSVVVKKNDEIGSAELITLAPDYLVIGPGPGTPNEAGISLAAIKQLAGRCPILGICLGHQAIGQVFGGQVVRASAVMHGRVSAIVHDNQGLFSGLPQGLLATRYHSLVVDKSSLPACLSISGYSRHATINALGTQIANDATQSLNDKPIEFAPHTDGDFEAIMALRHTSLAVTGVQFHPESILSQSGLALLTNFLKN